MDDEFDDEANADLSLEIVARAQRRQPPSSPNAHAFSPVEQVIELSSEEEDGSVSVGEKRPRLEDQIGERPKRRKDKASETLAEPVVVPETTGNSSKKSKRKNRLKRDKRGDEEAEIIGIVKEVTEEEEVEIIGTVKEITEEPQSPADAAERKAKRKPRYFDASGGMLAANRCYKCGELGHFAADCGAEPASRACHICGEFTHEGRKCTQASSCYICRDKQHLAKDCPQKGSRVCLLCGGAGHTASSCRKNYDEADLKALQCYICKEFGHLCCLDGLESFPTDVSCYNCGAVGHTGLACPKPRNESISNGRTMQVSYARDNNRSDEKEKTPKAKAAKEKPSCFKCGGEGHFARECSRSEEKTPQHCYKCGLGGHYARDCNQANQSDQQCFKCGQGGHYARDCTHTQADEKCYKCGREGHFARDCKKRWNSEADTDFPRRAKTPRSQEQLKEQKHHTPKNTNVTWKRHRSNSELVRENSAKKLPKWHEI